LEPDAPVVYSSNIFDTGLSHDRPDLLNTQPLSTEFVEYLKGRFDE